MKMNEIETNIGTISVKSVEFGELLIDMFFDIASIPYDIQKKITESLEVAKERQLYKMEHANEKFTLNTEDMDAKILLHISIDNNKGFSSWIESDMTNKDDDMVWICSSVKVDLSECMPVLKPFIINVATEKIMSMI